MKFLVLGCGSIGKRHIKNLIILGHKDIIGCDIDQKLLREVALLGVKVSSDFEACLKSSDAVLICTPNHLHTEYVMKSLDAGKHVFVEKPISNSLTGLEAATKILKKKKLVLQVGCNLRYHPLLRKVKVLLEKKVIGKIYSARIEFGSYFPGWRPSQDHKANYGAKKSMGGGVILDDIHEIDYAVWLFGNIQSVFCSAQRISDVTVDTEDTADMILRTKTGFDISLHMDYLQLSKTRTLKIIGSEGMIEGNIYANELRVFDGKDWKVEKHDFDFNQTYIDELKEFIRCIKNDSRPSVGLEEGLYALKIALALKNSAEKNLPLSVGLA